MNEITIGFVTFLLGLFLGNRLAIGRDKRREFNALTNDDYWRLKKHLDERENSKYFESVDVDNLVKAVHYISLRKEPYLKLVESYKENSSQQIIPKKYDARNPGAPIEVDPIKVMKTEQCIRKLLNYLKPR